MTTPLEIERKFLVDGGSVPLNDQWPVHFEDSWITQDYLKSAKGTTERVRSRTFENEVGTVYTHTLKRRVSDMTAEEDESEVTATVYASLLLRADPKRQTIEKKRREFVWKGQVFELDFFPDRNLFLLEIELESEDTEVTLPTFLTIVREVTDEKAYKNSELARR